MLDLDERIRIRAGLFRQACDTLGLQRTGDDRVTPIVAAAITGIPESTLRRWRSEGEGPPFHQIGRRIWYSIADLAEFIESSHGSALEFVSARERSPRSGKKKTRRAG